MKKHSEPILYLFILLMTSLLIVTWILCPIVAVLYYMGVGFLIWIICERVTSFIKTLLLWYPAILFDKTKLINN